MFSYRLHGCVIGIVYTLGGIFVLVNIFMLCINIFYVKKMGLGVVRVVHSIMSFTVIIYRCFMALSLFDQYIFTSHKFFDFGLPFSP